MHSKDTVELLRNVLEEAWSSLPPRQQMGARRSDMAAAILHAAAKGERDPAKLRKLAVRSREIVLEVA